MRMSIHGEETPTNHDDVKVSVETVETQGIITEFSRIIFDDDSQLFHDPSKLSTNEIKSIDSIRCILIGESFVNIMTGERFVTHFCGENNMRTISSNGVYYINDSDVEVMVEMIRDTVTPVNFDKLMPKKYLSDIEHKHPAMKFGKFLYKFVSYITGKSDEEVDNIVYTQATQYLSKVDVDPADHVKYILGIRRFIKEYLDMYTIEDILSMFEKDALVITGCKFSSDEDDVIVKGFHDTIDHENPEVIDTFSSILRTSKDFVEFMRGVIVYFNLEKYLDNILLYDFIVMVENVIPDMVQIYFYGGLLSNGYLARKVHMIRYNNHIKPHDFTVNYLGKYIGEEDKNDNV